jgi:hypothetical protein
MPRPPSLAITLLFLASASPALAEDSPTYERDIRPLFAKRCAVCHNAKKVDNLDLSGGLALDSFEALLEGTKDHKILQPGKAEESELLRRVTTSDEDLRMPLDDEPLAEDQRALIRRWIEAGAPRGDPLPPSLPTSPAKPSARRVARTLDVNVSLDAKVPAGVEGMGPGGAVALAMKVGPLPSVTALAFRGDGSQLAVGMYGQVAVWDLLDGRPAAVLSDLPGPVHALAYSPDGKRLAVGSGQPAQSGSVRIYRVPDGTLAQEFEGHGDVVYALAFRHDGGQLASAGFDQTVRLWDLTEGTPAGVFKGHSDFVYEVVYTPDGLTVLSASKDRSIKRFDARTGKGLRTYSDHNEDVLALAIRPDGSSFVTAGVEPQLRWWALDGEKPSKKVGGHGGPVHQLAFSADGKRLISAGGGDKTVRTWDGSSGIFQKTLPGPTEWQYAVALSHDGRLAAAGGWDGLVRVWDADAATLRAILIQPPAESPGQPDWLIAAPNGYLSGSPGLLSLVRWKVGGADVPPEAPRTAFARPDRLAQSLRGEAAEAPFPAPPK